MWQEVKIILFLFYWAIWGKEGQVEQTEISIQQVGTTGKKCSLKASHSLGEKSSIFKAMLLIRLHFRALLRNKYVLGIKCYLHTQLKREDVAKHFLLSTKFPLWSL